LRPSLRGLLGAFALLALAGCAGSKPPNVHRLALVMTPPELKAGQMIQVSASPGPGVEMAWVSGTVKVLGAPVMPFRKDSHGTWVFKTMIPAFASLSPGTYEARAWGDSVEGQRYEGGLFVDVK